MAESTLSDESADSDAAARAPKARGGCLWGCLIGMLPLYALSWPIYSIISAFVWKRGWHGMLHAMSQAERVIYAPLQWLYDNFAIVKSFYDWYFGIFMPWLPQP